MKTKIISTAAAFFTATHLNAGGITEIIMEPKVLAPDNNELSWDGFYAGLGLTHKNSYRIETKEKVIGTEEVVELVKPRDVSDGSTVTRDSTTSMGFSEYDGATILRISSTEAQTVTIQKFGSNNAPQVIQVEAGRTYVAVDGPGTYITTFQNGARDTKATGKQVFPDTATRIIPIIEIFKDIIEDSSPELNIFAGYRHLFNNGTFVGMELGKIGGAEIQFGLAARGNPWATYVGANTDGEITLGADRLMGNGDWFVGGKVAYDYNDDDMRAEVRLGLKF